MPISKRWSRWSAQRVNQESNNYGAYELGDRNTGEVLYVGSGRVLSRLLAHLPPGQNTKPGISGYRVEYTRSGKRARGRERRLLFDFKNENGNLPRFNNDIPPPL